MPVTAKVYRKFYETFEDEIANELVQWVAKVKAGLRSGLAEQRAEPVGLAIAVRWLALRCLFCHLRRVCHLPRVLPIPLAIRISARPPDSPAPLARPGVRPQRPR